VGLAAFLQEKLGAFIICSLQWGTFTGQSFNEKEKGLSIGGGDLGEVCCDGGGGI